MLAVLGILSAVLMGIVLVFAKQFLLENVGMVSVDLYLSCAMSMAENKMFLAAEEGCEL